jgi:hypothetical protein
MLTVAEVRARGITLPIDDGYAQDVIDEAEAWLAARIGPLDGPRTEIFTDPYSTFGVVSHQWYSAVFRLHRQTDSVEVTEAAVEVPVALHGDIYVVRDEGYWTGPVSVTYTPTDDVLVRGTLFDLLRLGTTETGFESETMGSYSYTRPRTSTVASRWALWRRFLPRLGFDSVPVRSGFDRPYSVTITSSDIVVSGS